MIRRLDVDVTHTHVFNATAIGRVAAFLARVPVRVGMIPGPYRLEAAATRRLDLATQRLDHRIIPGSRWIENLYLDLGVSPDRLRWIPYPHDPLIFDPELADGARVRTELAIPATTPLIGQVAHFYPVVDTVFTPPGLRNRGVKGHEDFLAAARTVLDARPDVRFLLVGADWGPEGKEHRIAMQELARELGVDHAVIFAGYRTDVRDVLAALDVAVQASLTENYGGTIEALTMARPMIATRVGGMPETVRDGETGLLVPARDPDALAAAMLRLIDDPALSSTLAEHGRALMLEHFTITHTVDGIDALYRELLDEHGIA
ncbi:MAG: glycosyltransferase [Actinomycetes bacterium]